MEQTAHPMDTEKEAHGTYRSYIIGFVLSIVLTLAAYFLVTEHVLAGWTLIFAIIGLSIVQVLVQLLFFLHLGQESKPYWNLISFLFMVLVVGIVVAGSLWIMYNLDERVMHAGMDDKQTHLETQF